MDRQTHYGQLFFVVIRAMQIQKTNQSDVTNIIFKSPAFPHIFSIANESKDQLCYNKKSEWK